MTRLHRTADGHLSDGRYSLESDLVEEDCDCEGTCTHPNPGLRQRVRWTIWDSERGDHAAWIGYPYCFATQRDARRSLEANR
jgi:hypothetical protein